LLPPLTNLWNLKFFKFDTWKKSGKIERTLE
jgi:hypothetical protein